MLQLPAISYASSFISEVRSYIGFADAQLGKYRDALLSFEAATCDVERHAGCKAASCS
jgi:hypothetical protein